MQATMKSPNLEVSSDVKKSLISPVIKHNSRGARFLDLVRSNKLDVSPQLSKRLSFNKHKHHNLMDLMTKSDKKENTPNGDTFLSFSPAVQFDPSQSPSQSILSKRKPETPDSPACHGSAKRKRVSFNDPVSTTKEYLVTEEEERLKSNSLIRCLTYENNDEEKVTVAVERVEEENLVDSNNLEEDSDEPMESEKPEIKEENDENIPPANYPVNLDHNYDERDEKTQNTDITTSSLEEEILSTPPPSQDGLTFKDRNELMEYITKNLTVDELFEKLTQAEEQSMKRKELIEKVLTTIDMNELLNEILPITDAKQSKLSTEQTEATSVIINHISKLMKASDRVKHKVLETFSEKHSKDFLTHALQENSTSTVCEKLTIPNIVTYLIHKVNVCENDELDVEMNRMNRAIMHHLLKSTHNHHEIINDQKETQEMLKLLFKNKPKIDVLDTVHEFLRDIIQQHN